MNTPERLHLDSLITQAAENCKPLKKTNVSTQFEEYWQRFSNPNQTELENIEVRIIKQYIQKAKVEYKEALLDTLKSQIGLSTEQETTTARKRYESLRDIITYKQ